MKHLYVIFIVLLQVQLFAQVPRGEELEGLHSVQTSNLNAITNPIIGSILYNPTDEKVYYYTANGWKAAGSEKSDIQFDASTGILSMSLPATTGNQVDLSTHSAMVTPTNSNLQTQTIATHTAQGTTVTIEESITTFEQNSTTGDINYTNENNTITTLKLISSDTNNAIELGSDKGAFKRINKSYVQTFKTSTTLTSGNAIVLHVFPEITIQANKKVYFKLYVPTRETSDAWNGVYVNVNVKVNGTWYNLGNTGYDGGAMSYSARSIHALNHEMLLDFITHLNLPEDQDYTIQFELMAKTYGSTMYINRSHAVNYASYGLNSRGNVQSWASDQNFCHIIIQEKDR